MGTFILRPVSVSANDGEWQVRLNGGAVTPNPTNPQLVAAVQVDNLLAHTELIIPNGTPGSPDVSYSCIGLGIYLDGSPTPTDTNNLPLGFTVISANVRGQIACTATSISFLRDNSPVATFLGPIGITSVDVALGAISTVSLINSILGVSGSSAGVGQVEAAGIRIEGEYIASSFAITLNPASGDVEPGQIIRATGSNILGINFVGTVGNKVIPLVTKPDGPDVLIEVPYPPTDDCVDCLTTDCVDCDDCFTVCNEDLESEECAECMAACLACLEQCLEDVDLAENCDNSSGTPPEIDIVIICGDPGNQFSGSVPLGTFTIIVANGSGIYRFVDGKTNDTVYTAERDGTTLDIKIPNPFGKSGFFRS